MNSDKVQLSKDFSTQVYQIENFIASQTILVSKLDSQIINNE